MSNLKGKNFEDKKGNTFTVIDVDGTIAHLNDGSRIAVERLIDPEFFTHKGMFNESVINENNSSTNLIDMFDNNKRYQNLASQIAEGLNSGKIDMSKAPEVGGAVAKVIDNVIVDNRSTVNSNINADQDEMNALMEKARSMSSGNVVHKVQQQNEMLAKYADEADIDQSIVHRLDNTVYKVESEQPQQVNQIESKLVFEDPAVAIFKGVKRGQKFSILVKIDDMIPTKEFMKMMEDNYDTSIIDFLASDMYKKIMSDPIVIKKQIADKLREMVYPKKKTKPTAKKATPKKVVKKTTK